MTSDAFSSAVHIGIVIQTSWNKHLAPRWPDFPWVHSPEAGEKPPPGYNLSCSDPCCQDLETHVKTPVLSLEGTLALLFSLYPKVSPKTCHGKAHRLESGVYVDSRCGLGGDAAEKVGKRGMAREARPERHRGGHRHSKWDLWQREWSQTVRSTAVMFKLERRVDIFWGKESFRMRTLFADWSAGLSKTGGRENV